MSKKELHMATCIEDLNKHFNLSNMKQAKCKMLCSSANKTYEKALHNYRMGDDEVAYIFFMKYLNLIHRIRASSEYIKNKADFNQLIDIQHISDAINFAEELSKSLTNRYKDLGKSTELKKDRTLQEEKHNSQDKNELNHNQNVIETDSRKMQFISCVDLYNIINSSRSYLIIDTRNSDDYAKSHIISKYIISLPKEEIVPGMSANKLALSLAENDMSLFEMRGSKESIVLLDSDCDPNNISHSLQHTYTALVEWDPQVKYKSYPVVLKGGYNEFVLMYPTLCSNPKESILSRPDLHYVLDNVVYPFNEMNIESQRTNPLKPSVDRNSKVAAVKLYDEQKSKMTDLLKRHEKNVDNSILLERRRLTAEQEWETLRLSREKEAEEEKRIAMQEHLQVLQQRIMQMDSFQRDKIMENEDLRKQLEEYKRKELENQRLTFDNSVIQDQEEIVMDFAERIEKKERERQKLDQQRENLAKERQRKLEEAKAFKQESLKRFADTSYANINDQAVSNSKMKRSLSTPNVAQLDLDAKIMNNVPQYDRSIKPSVTQYDYSVKQDTDLIAGKGLCGLRNLGNTCYMNSILQCLGNTSLLIHYFCSGTYREHLNRNNETRGRIAEEFATVITTLWSGHYRTFTICEFKKAIGQFNKLFRGSGQQDSHEFLMILIDLLHLDLQIYKNRLKQDLTSPSYKAWAEYTKDKESIILNLFYGQIRSTVTCTVCSKESVTFDVFSNLSLELPSSSNRCSLSDCLNLYLNGEKISGWRCPECQAKREAVKKLDIAKLPLILVIHFKRFYADGFSNKVYHKKQNYIDFPMTDLRVPSMDSNTKFSKYNLYAVSNHYGSMESGHYTAYCKSNMYDKWYKFDDQIVSQIDSNDVNSSAAYILFYQGIK